MRVPVKLRISPFGIRCGNRDPARMARDDLRKTSGNGICIGVHGALTRPWFFRAINRLHPRVKKPVAFAVFRRAKPRHLPAAERQRHIHAGGRGIEFKHPRPRFGQKFFLKFGRMAEQRGHQTVADAVAQVATPARSSPHAAPPAAGLIVSSCTSG